MGLIAAGLISGGIGLLGGIINSQRKFKGWGQMDSLINELANPQKQLASFRRVAQDAAPSRSEMMSLAAATGGSASAAAGQTEQARLQAGSQAANAFAQYRQGVDSLRASLVGQKTNMKMQDFQNRRGAITSAMNQVAGMGLGIAGNQIGLNQANAAFADQMQTVKDINPFGMNSNVTGLNMPFQPPPRITQGSLGLSPPFIGTGAMWNPNDPGFGFGNYDPNKYNRGWITGNNYQRNRGGGFFGWGGY